jgi:hypothetical protein
MSARGVKLDIGLNEHEYLVDPEQFTKAQPRKPN